MQAVIKTGGKQFIVKPGDIIDIEKLDVGIGESVEFKEVLFVTDDNNKATVGTPNVENAVVKGKVLGEIKGEKIIVFKFKRRKGYRNKNGHRQKYSKIEITDINN